MTEPGQDDIVAPTPPFDVLSNYKGWTESAEHRAAVAELHRRMEVEGIEGVYLVSPSVDGRPVGKFVTRDNFQQIANNGISLHPLAMTDFRGTALGQPDRVQGRGRRRDHGPGPGDVPQAPVGAAAGPHVLLLLRQRLGRST